MAKQDGPGVFEVTIAPYPKLLLRASSRESAIDEYMLRYQLRREELRKKAICKREEPAEAARA